MQIEQKESKFKCFRLLFIRISTGCYWPFPNKTRRTIHFESLAFVKINLFTLAFMARLGAVKMIFVHGKKWRGFSRTKSQVQFEDFPLDQAGIFLNLDVPFPSSSSSACQALKTSKSEMDLERILPRTYEGNLSVSPAKSWPTFKSVQIKLNGSLESDSLPEVRVTSRQNLPRRAKSNDHERNFKQIFSVFQWESSWRYLSLLLNDSWSQLHEIQGFLQKVS